MISIHYSSEKRAVKEIYFYMNVHQIGFLPHVLTLLHAHLREFKIYTPFS